MSVCGQCVCVCVCGEGREPEARINLTEVWSLQNWLLHVVEKESDGHNTWQPYLRSSSLNWVVTVLRPATSLGWNFDLWEYNLSINCQSPFDQ